jgi:hypothetical protein
MTKRKKNVDHDYDSGEEDSASDFEVISVKRSTASRRKRRSTTARKVSAGERAETPVPLDTYYVTSHSRSQHLISSPDLMRSSLLEWYSGVHEVRGMPWRRPFDPSLDADARAQRAYEVSRQNVNQRVGVGCSIQCCLCRAEGLDLGDHASADASRNRDPLLQQVDEQVSALVTSARMTP